MHSFSRHSGKLIVETGKGENLLALRSSLVQPFDSRPRKERTGCPVFSPICSAPSVIPSAIPSGGHSPPTVGKSACRILVDQARRRKAGKRGGDRNREELNEAAIVAPEPADDVEALNDALDRLEKLDAAACQLIKLRFFAGLTATEAAEAMGMSVRSAHDLWAYARSWLRRELKPT
jgi:ECF sigma factor